MHNICRKQTADQVSKIPLSTFPPQILPNNSKELQCDSSRPKSIPNAHSYTTHHTDSDSFSASPKTTFINNDGAFESGVKTQRCPAFRHQKGRALRSLEQEFRRCAAERTNHVWFAGWLWLGRVGRKGLPPRKASLGLDVFSSLFTYILEPAVVVYIEKIILGFFGALLVCY